MPLPNRVTPLGALVADPARGLVYGNRGCLHDDSGRIRRRFNGKRWIACRFTELFFLDEATAFAAGHRPCALCRREDYDRFGALWRELHPGQVGADAIDAQLHSERVTDARGQRHHVAALAALPDGSFVLLDGDPWLVLGPRLLRWTVAGYADPRPRPGASQARLITPPSLVAVLHAGWASLVPLLHPSARTAN
jgi:hypothetical protein